MVELVDTVVLEATSSECEFESRLGHQKYGCVGKLVTPGDCKSPATGTVGSTPTASTKLWKVNPIGDGTGLENRRVLIAPLEFDSLTFRQIRMQ